MQARPLDWQAVSRRRIGRWASSPIVYRPTLDSTNALAADLIPDRAPPGSVVVADYQFAGRGRLTRRWHAEPYSALTATVVLGPHQPPWTAPLAAGLAALEAVEAQGVAAALKWPNDVLIQGRKCGGILIESRAVAGIPWLLAGVGLNVHSVDPALDTATYLDAFLERSAHREDVLERLLLRLDYWCDLAAYDGTALHAAWRSRLTTLGRRVTVTAPATSFTGTASDVADDGALIVILDDGSVRVVQAGDVTLSSTLPK